MVVGQLIDKTTQLREELKIAERLQGTHDLMKIRIQEIKEVLKLSYHQFDGSIFKSLIEKVVIKSKKEMRFIFKCGMEKDWRIDSIA